MVNLEYSNESELKVKDGIPSQNCQENMKIYPFEHC